MPRSTARRLAAVLGGAAPLVTVPAPASAQGSLADLPSVGVTESLQNLAGGSLAAVGSGALGTASAGGRCAAIDPSLGSVGGAIRVQVTSVEGAPGVARFAFTPGIYLGTGAATVRWTNTTTGATGVEVFGPVGGPSGPITREVATGAGHVTWTIDDGRMTGSLASPGGTGDGITLPASPCSGGAEIA